MFPNRAEAKKLLADAELHNPGAWGRHSQVVGYDEVARFCASHSFSIQRIEDYIGNFDVTKEQQKVIEDYLGQLVYDDYDRLIQLCDAIGSAEGVVSMEERMGDVKRRYGAYPQDKWDKNLQLKDYFSEKIGRDVYSVLQGPISCS